MAEIIVKRKRELFNYLRRYRVYLNDDLAGIIYDGESIRRIVPNGNNTLQVRLEWCGSRVHEFSMKPDEIKTFEVSALETSRIMNFVMAGLLILFYLFPPTFLNIPWYFNMVLVVCAILLIIYQMTLGRDRFLEINEIKMEPTISKESEIT